MSVLEGLLMTLAKAHQRLVRPGIVVEDRDLDDARLHDGGGPRSLRLQPLHFRRKVVRCNAVGIELDLERGVGRADLGHACNSTFANGVGDR